MSWKSVELQVALPRAQDAGKQQEQMSKQNQRFQESLAQNQVKMEERKRTQVNKFDALTKSAIQDEAEKENSQSSADDGQNDSNDTEKEETSTHPYLGSQIDYKG